MQNINMKKERVKQNGRKGKRVKKWSRAS